MSRIAELREQVKNKAIECRRILDNTPKEKALSAEDNAKYNALTEEIVNLQDAIRKEQALLDAMADEFFDQESAPKKTRQNDNGDIYRSAFNTWLKGGLQALNLEEMHAYRNTMSTTTGSQGGFTVPTQVASQLISSLKDYGAMRNVAEVITTESGGALSYPTTDGTTEIGEWVPENVQATPLDVVFGTAALNCFKAGSKVVVVPIELLMDSSIDIEKMVNARLSERLGRISNLGYTVGTGSGQPFGVVTRASVGKVLSTGKTVTFDYDDLIDVQESLDEAYRIGGKARWMMAQPSRRILRKLKDTNGRPIWTPGYELGAVAGIPDLLLGDVLTINNDMATPAANAKSVVFGDLSRYIIRDSMQVSLFRFTDSKYTELGQVGFLAWMRTGGNLMDTAAVKSMQQSAT
jgi:HK97 family phage major capsid protein